jgi:hypothetical protein
MILDNAILQGQPHLPHDMVEVSGVIKEHHVRFVYIDPMGQPSVRPAQVAEHSRRQASHRSAAVYSRASHCAWCSQTHIRTEAKVICARVGLSAVLRQAARCCCSRSNRQTMTRS